MTCQGHCTLSNEIVEGIINQGMDYIPEMIRILINLAMQMERQAYLQAGSYERTPERRDYANGCTGSCAAVPAAGPRPSPPRPAPVWAAQMRAAVVEAEGHRLRGLPPAHRRGRSGLAASHRRPLPPGVVADSTRERRVSIRARQCTTHSRQRCTSKTGPLWLERITFSRGKFSERIGCDREEVRVKEG